MGVLSFHYISLRSQDLYRQLSQVVNIDLGLGITQNDLIHAGEMSFTFESHLKKIRVFSGTFIKSF